MKNSRSSRSGSTLIIVVLFMGLLLGLAILFLLSALTAVQLSNSSVAEANSTSLATGAGDTIIGDLRQEIADGSTIPTGAPFNNAQNVPAYPVYQPKPSTGPLGLSTAVPALVGFVPTIVNGQETDGLANLVKISSRGTPFYNNVTNTNYSESGVTRASAVSTSLASLDGRVISPARWNSHYLIQRAVKNSQGTAVQGTLNLDPTPVAAFPRPDWVIVTRAGDQKTYTSTDIANKLGNSSSTEYAVGRFAYAIYNEGGVLDMNAAGYPSQLTAQQVCQKGSLAFADLTQLSVPSVATLLSQNNVDQIVGWRNPYTAQLGSAGSQFGFIAFTANASTSWVNNFAVYNNCQTNVLLPNYGLKNGFMSVNYTTPLTSIPSAPSDQMFVSRSQLISLVGSLGILPDALQYMGTFSRSLEQPSYTPNPARPVVGGTQAGGISFASTTPPTSGGSEGNYDGNNDAQNLDYVAASPSTSINPPFLGVRVLQPFTRFNGQAAQVGEPLVRYRFPLSSLALVAYNATNTSLPTGFTATATDLDPIYDHFGLKRSSTGNPWVYNHGANKIYTLAQVAALNREPDFAELLKASIIAGGLAKGAPNQDIAGSPYANYQYTYDTTVDFQVLQIMANLIDQQDADSYPTWIQIASDPTQLPSKSSISGSTNIYGVEDLPYLYGWHLLGVEDTIPTPNPLHSNVVYACSNAQYSRCVTLAAQWAFPTGVITQPSPYNALATIPLQSGTLPALPAPQLYSPYNITNAVQSSTPLTYGHGGTAGDYTFLYIPELWNPHDPTTAAQNQGLRPTKFRIWAQSAPPNVVSSQMATPPGSPGPNEWWHGGISGYSGNNPDGSTGGKSIIPQNTATTYYQPISPAAPLTQANTELDFSDNSGLLFREPTLLWNNSSTTGSNNPSGINLTAVNPLLPVTDSFTHSQFYGIFAGQCPLLVQFTLASYSSPGGPSTPDTTDAGGAVPGSPDGTYVADATTVAPNTYLPGGAVQKMTFFLQYQDGNGNWITYDTKYPDEHATNNPQVFSNIGDYSNGQYYNPIASGAFQFNSYGVDPRTARWGMSLLPSAGGVTLSGKGSLASVSTGNNPPNFASPVLDPTANGTSVADTNILGGYNASGNKLANNVALGTSRFSVMETLRPRADKGNTLNYSCPGTLATVSTPAYNPQERLFGGINFSASLGGAASQKTFFFGGMLSQNNPSVVVTAKDDSTASSLYFEDADGVGRRAMGAYADPNLVDSDTDTTSHVANGPTFSNLPEAVVPGTFPASGSAFPPANTRIGLPEATASNIQAGATKLGTATPTQQAQSRPLILNRPFRSVSEMSYSFTGTPWKNIDFFTPESAYTGLLDTFCVGQAPANGLVAGKVDLNTRQAPVIQALVSGATRDEWTSIPAPTGNVAQLSAPMPLPPISSVEAALIAQRLVAYTTDKTDIWRGPLANLSDLVGRFIPNMPASPSNLPGATAQDWYTYTAPSKILANTLTTSTFSYAGFTGLLDSSVYTNNINNSNLVSPIIQRFKESGLRPLADCGQTRVWNLLIDVIAQSGKYPKSATGLDQFAVEGEKRMWIHVAIDRQTGQVLDKQVEVVNQ